MLGTNIKIQPTIRSRYVDFGSSRQDISTVSGAIISESKILGLISFTGGNGLQGFQGLQGVQGIQGFQGSVGLGTQGFQGVQGSLGLQGIQGPTGLGTQGLQGIQGPTGLGTQGLQGVQGKLGLQGFQGYQGSIGPTGLGFQGVQGPIGVDGTAGGLIQMTQLLDNIQATGSSAVGSVTIANWTKAFTSNGGTTNFQVSFTSYASSIGLRTFDILVDGSIAGSSTLYFNQANVHTTIPSNFSIENLSAGSHTFAIRIPAGSVVDTADYGNASIIEVVGANTIGLTGPQGNGVLASFMRGSRNASQAGVVANTVIVFNQVDNSYSSDISLNVGTGVITLAADKSYRIIGCVPDFSSLSSARPSFAWYNRTTSSQIGSLAAAYNASDAANYGTFGGISECIITPNVSTDIDFRCINALSSFTAGGNTDFTSVGSYPWFEIEVIAGNAPSLMGATGPTGPVSTSLYANLGLSANVVGVGNGTDITWNSNISSTEITVSGTNITVPAGTYYIMGDINAFNFTDTTAGYLNVSLVKASDNSVISGITQANPGPSTATYNYSVSSSIIGIVTFATSTVIKARIVNAVGTATLASANTRLLITSINI